MKLEVPAIFLPLMGDEEVTVESVLAELAETESHLSSGDCCKVRYADILSIARKRLALAISAFGAESPQAKAVLENLGFYFYMAAKFENAGTWQQVVQCFEQRGSGGEEYVAEARTHL